MLNGFNIQYLCNTTFNGGVPVYVPLHPPEHSKHTTIASSEWKLDFDELRAAITPKTKAMCGAFPRSNILETLMLNLSVP